MPPAVHDQGLAVDVEGWDGSDQADVPDSVRDDREVVEVRDDGVGENSLMSRRIVLCRHHDRVSG
ncbi:MAG: hypothetical protein IH973_06455 [Myxococcales bacterium]|nr:hypothetical protein [Myxococcales bacterium]